MGLEAHLTAEAEAAKPEYLRQRPKFYYYYEWCKKRIHAHVSRPSLLSREWVKRAAQLASMLQGLEFAKMLSLTAVWLLHARLLLPTPSLVYAVPSAAGACNG